MSEKLENNEVSEQNLEQVAGGVNIDDCQTFIYRCMKCNAMKLVTASAPPSVAPTCCGVPMEFEGV